MASPNVFPPRLSNIIHRRLCSWVDCCHFRSMCRPVSIGFTILKLRKKIKNYDYFLTFFKQMSENDIG